MIGTCSSTVVECGGDIAAGEVDHRGQRQDQSGVGPIDVEPPRGLECSFGFGEPSGHERHPGVDDRQSFVLVDEVSEPLDVAGDRVGASDVEELGGVGGDEVGGLDAATGSQVVLDGRHQLACFGVPPAGGGVELGAPLRDRTFELGAQQVLEKVVEPEPRPGPVEGDDELVGRGQVGEPLGAVVDAADLVDQRSGEAVEDRHLEEPATFVRVDRVEELVGEVVGDELVAAVEGLDEVVDVVLAAQGQAGEHEPSGPTLRAVMEALDGVWAQSGGFGVEEPPRFVSVEAEVVGPDLGELVADAEPSEPERRVHTGRQHEDQVRGSERDEAFDAAMHVGVGHEVVVVDHQHHVTVDGADLVHHGAHHGAEPIGLGRTHRFAEARHRLTQRSGDVGPEARRVVVALVDLQPPGLGVTCVEPPVDQGRLP